MKSYIKNRLNFVFESFQFFFFSNILKFLVYNFFLPILLPLVIMIFVVYSIGSQENIESIWNLIIQSVYLYLIVSFFTNIGFWSNDQLKANESDKNYRNKESYIALSLVFGVLCVSIYSMSFIITNSIIVYILFLLALLLVFISLFFYYQNPLIIYSSNNEVKDREEVREEDNKSESIIYNKIKERRKE